MRVSSVRWWWLAAPIGLLLTVCLAACSSLPTIHPDLARQGTSKVRLEGTRGVLSASQSKAILDRLKTKSPQTSIFERHLAIEESIAGSPLTIGNKVVLLLDGPSTYRAMFAAISAFMNGMAAARLSSLYWSNWPASAGSAVNAMNAERMKCFCMFFLNKN